MSVAEAAAFQVGLVLLEIDEVYVKLVHFLACHFVAELDGVANLILVALGFYHLGPVIFI